MIAGLHGRADPAAEPTAEAGPVAADDPHDGMAPPGEFAMPVSFTMPEPTAAGLEDSACPAFDGGPLALLFRMQVQLEQLGQAFGAFCTSSADDRRDMRRLLETHTRDEAPRLRAIQTRLNVTLALVLAVGLFALAGPEGLRQIGDAVSRDGSLGLDGIVTLGGAAIPLLYPLGRLIFLRIDGGKPVAAPKESDRHG
jgi:hypothetical protein